MQSLVARRLVTPRRRHGRELLSCSSEYTHLGTDRVAIAFHSNELEYDPVILSFGFVQQNQCGTVVCSDHRIHSSIIVDVSDRHTARRPLLMKHASRRSRDVDKLLSL